MEDTKAQSPLPATSSTAKVDSSEDEPLPPDEPAYVVPIRCVKHHSDLQLWEKSQAYYDIIGFINGVSHAIQGRSLASEEVPTSEVAQKIITILTDRLETLLKETPALEQPQRFGNVAYRVWSEKLRSNAVAYLQEALPEKFYRAIPEIVVYFIESFGNATRVDYGTGHELAFIMFMCCLFKVGALHSIDQAAAGLKIFNAYLLFVRKLQIEYRMEPAGSHGVWSLDDYQFVPFIWGSAQLAVNAPFRPPQFLEENIIAEYKDSYMFLGCIDYIMHVKTGHFGEHSPQLWNVSAVESWIKINAGLVRMYQRELLAKFPVVQHVLFGSLMSFAPVKDGSQLSTARLGMLPPASSSRFGHSKMQMKPEVAKENC